MKKIGILFISFLIVIFRLPEVHAQPEWSVDTLAPNIGVTMYCLPEAPAPTVPLAPGDECLGEAVDYTFAQTDNQPGDSNIYQYTPLASNCRVTPTTSLPVVEPTKIQNCVLQKYGGTPFIVYNMDRAGNVASASVDNNAVVYGWYKMNGTSFHRLGNIDHRIPQSPLPFDATDTSDPHVVVRNYGAVTASNNIALRGSTAQVSTNRWRRPGYTLSREYETVNELIGVLKLLHSHTVIADLSEVQSDGIYVIGEDITINNSNIFNGKNNFVILAEGASVTISVNLNIPSSPGEDPPQSFAIITDQTLQLHSLVTTLGGIYVGQNVDLAYDVTTNIPVTHPLKVIGNLTSFSAIANIKREDEELRQPSFYIEYNQKIYFDLINQLSRITQNGWQVE